MNILITGGLGFIGHKVVQNLETMGHNVIIIDNKSTYGEFNYDELRLTIDKRAINFKTKNIFQVDILMKANVEYIFNQFKPEIVLHLASTPSRTHIENDILGATKMMCEGTVNLLELSKKYNVDKFVFASSVAVYGDTEYQVNEASELNPKSIYGLYTELVENLIKQYTQFKHSILRLSNIYGPTDLSSRIVNTYIGNAKNDEVLIVNGQDTKIDLLYVDDAAIGIAKATVSTNTNNNTYNLCYGASVSIRDLANNIIKNVKKGKLELRDMNNNNLRHGVFDISKSQNDFEFNPRFDINSGLESYLNYLINK